VGSAAEQWAAQGKLDSFLAANPGYAKTINSSFFDNLTGSYMESLQAKNAAALANLSSPTRGATLGSWAGTQAAERDQAGAAPEDEAQAKKDEALAQSTFDLAAPATAPVTAVAAPATPAAPAAPVAVELGDVVNVPTLNTIDFGETPTTSAQPTAMSSTSKSAPTYTGIDAIDSRINNALANPGQTAINMGVGLVPGLGLANTVSGLFGGPTVGGLISGAYNSGAISGGQPSETGDTGSGSNNDYIPPSDLTTTGTAGLSTAPAAATPPTAATTPVQQAAIDAAVRRYMGASNNPYSYGFGKERQFYAADGGQFNADQYFADGGMVQPLSPPTTPLISAQPTMAFTDGAGAVGSIAQPPGLAPSDSYGSDAPHASPMAPSVAASVPTMQPGLATLAVPNVNASPVTSQVSQNPNVGYALGNSPLSNLTRP
jgi:hypothetical protein